MSVKAPVFPFKKLRTVDFVLGPEMRSTGEVMGIDEQYPLAFAKALLAAGIQLPTKGRVLISVNDPDKPRVVSIARELHEMGFEIFSTIRTKEVLAEHGIPAALVSKHDGKGAPFPAHHDAGGGEGGGGGDPGAAGGRDAGGGTSGLPGEGRAALASFSGSAHAQGAQDQCIRRLPLTPNQSLERQSYAGWRAGCVATQSRSADSSRCSSSFVSVGAVTRSTRFSNQSHNTAPKANRFSRRISFFAKSPTM
jgi:hypothetical protein